jgi:hypothetical protein
VTMPVIALRALRNIFSVNLLTKPPRFRRLPQGSGILCSAC